ncbi:MAG: hypothetical protein RPU91_09585 [Candidatus Sedimenticola sp. (ex Thyasira tokunagai)]
MARNEKPLNELREEIDNFTSFDKAQLIKRREWGTISLEEASLDFERIYDIVNYLSVLPLELLTVNSLTTIKTEITNINALFLQINEFTIESDNPAAQRDSFVSQVQTKADSLYTQASPWIPFLAYQKGDVSKNIESLTESVKEAEQLITTSKETITEKEDEIKNIITKAREASAAAGAAVFTQDFQKESGSLEKAAVKWLRITAILAVGTLAVALLMWFLAEPGLDRGQIWQKLGSKLAVLGILISGTFWCGKIYKALMHQATINKHRALSIQTLQAFSAAVDDTNTKDAVVLEATRAVFGNVPTGYIDNSPSSDGDIKIFEIAKNIIPKTGG